MSFSAFKLLGYSACVSWSLFFLFLSCVHKVGMTLCVHVLVGPQYLPFAVYLIFNDSPVDQWLCSILCSTVQKWSSLYSSFGEQKTLKKERVLDSISPGIIATYLGGLQGKDHIRCTFTNLWKTSVTFSLTQAPYLLRLQWCAGSACCMRCIIAYLDFTLYGMSCAMHAV